MGDTVKSPLKLQVFPQQRIKDLPKDQDIELALVPKQVIQIQGVPTSAGMPKLAVTVDASNRSRLHYSPSNCQSGQDACFESPGLHEIWVPEVQNENALIKLTGMTIPHDLKIPRGMFDPKVPLKIAIGEIPCHPSFPINTSPQRQMDLMSIPEDAEDFYIALADNTAVLAGGGFWEGGGDLSTLSELQKTMLKSLVKETVAAGGAVLDEKDLLKDFGFRGKYFIKERNGVKYVVFKGNSGLRMIFRNSQYNLAKDYSKLSILTVKEGIGQAAKQSLGSLKALSKGTVIGFLFMGAVNSWAWLSDEGEEKFIKDLIIDMGSDLAKSIIAGVVGAMFVGAIVASITSTIPVFAVVVGTIGAGMAIGLTLDYLDEKAGFTSAIKDAQEKIEPELKTFWKELIDNPFEKVLNRCLWEIKRGQFP